MNKDKPVNVECPNCGMLALENNIIAAKELFIECKFCGTKYRWMRTKSTIIIPADRKQYIYIKKG